MSEKPVTATEAWIVQTKYFHGLEEQNNLLRSKVERLESILAPLGEWFSDNGYPEKANWIKAALSDVGSEGEKA